MLCSILMASSVALFQLWSSRAFALHCCVTWIFVPIHGQSTYRKAMAIVSCLYDYLCGYDIAQIENSDCYTQCVLDRACPVTSLGDGSLDTICNTAACWYCSLGRWHYVNAGYFLNTGNIILLFVLWILRDSQIELFINKYILQSLKWSPRSSGMRLHIL